MYLNVLTDNKFKKSDIQALYDKQLHCQANAILYNCKYGTTFKTNKLLYLMLKYHKPAVEANSGSTVVLNKLFDVLNV